MTVLGRYLAGAGRPEDLHPDPAEAPFDELADQDGSVRRGWLPLLRGLEEFTEGNLGAAQREVARLLADDGVTYTPSPLASVSIADPVPPAEPAKSPPALEPPRRWELDPLPLILDEREWAGLEAGIVQRAHLLDAILADLYGARRLLAGRHLPAAAVLDHAEYLRPVVGLAPGARQPLFLLAVDLGRDAHGQWKVISDRTQAPSGAGYAMANRRVVSRVVPDLYHSAHLHRLTPFFQTVRTAALDAAPMHVESPRVVVLSPGTHSETAFDQAFVASTLGFPLLEGSDLVVRDGRVWMRVLGKLEPVDVILRRVDSSWCDPLELRAGSRLGVPGLLECVRRGSVSVINPLGSGILENPALMPLLPELCSRLLGQPLGLPSAQTWWCGEPSALDHVVAHLDSLVIRPTSRGHGRGVVGSALTAAQRERVLARIRANPHRYVGQEVLRLSTTPTSDADRLVGRPVLMRTFAVQGADEYVAMPGGLARVAAAAEERKGPFVTAPGGGLAKDVWVVSSTPIAEPRRSTPRLRPAAVLSHPVPFAAMVPRVLSDLFWFGRYAERAEDLIRLVLATRGVAIETDLDTTTGGALAVLLRAVTHVSTTYPGFLAPDTSMMPELRALLLDRHRQGSAAQALGALSVAAQGVRDQLSDDVWMVLAEIDRAGAALAANPYDQGLQLTDASEHVLSALLALAGIVGENMIRDPGWYMIDSGRGIERALQVLALLQATVGRVRTADTERSIGEAVLTASESIVTFRRRYRGRSGIQPLIELLVLDRLNPRSVAYQLARLQRDLRAMPRSAGGRGEDLVGELEATLALVEPVQLTEVSAGRRPALEALLAELQSRLRAVSDAIRETYQRPLPTQQSMWQPWTSEGIA